MELSRITEMVTEYFKGHGVESYTPIAVLPNDIYEPEEQPNYRVLAKYTGSSEFNKGTYAVWTVFNTKTGGMDHGHYNMKYEDAFAFFIGKEEQPIAYDRLMQIAVAFQNRIEYENDDEEEVYRFFEDTCEMDKKEMGVFGIEKPKRADAYGVDEI